MKVRQLCELFDFDFFNLLSIRQKMIIRTRQLNRILGRRCASTGALDRLLLDIHAAHNADQQRAGEATSPVEKSDAAKRGESMRGDVVLPLELQDAVNAVGDSKSPYLV